MTSTTDTKTRSTTGKSTATYAAVILASILLIAAGLLGINWQPASAQSGAPGPAPQAVTAPADDEPEENELDTFQDECGDEYDEDEWWAFEEKIFTAAAQSMGTDLDTLYDALDGGKSIAQVAEAKGVDSQAVIDAMVAQANIAIDEMVAAGDLTQAEADEWRAELVDEITFEVNAVYPDPFLIAGQTIGVDEDAFWEALESGQTVAEIAQANGVDPQAVVDAVIAAETAVIDQELAVGYIDEAEAEKWRAEMDAFYGDMVNMTLDELEAEWDKADGYDPFAVAAKTVGLDEDALWEALKSGQTVAQIAQANEVDPQAVVDAVIAAESALIDKELADGYIDQAEADEWRAELDEFASKMVDMTLDEFEAGWDKEYEEYENGEWEMDKNESAKKNQG